MPNGGACGAQVEGVVKAVDCNHLLANADDEDPFSWFYRAFQLRNCWPQPLTMRDVPTPGRAYRGDGRIVDVRVVFSLTRRARWITDAVEKRHLFQA